MCSSDSISPATSSTADFMGVGSPRRSVASAVTSALASENCIRSLTDSAEKPPKTTLWIAPIRAHASIAATASGTIGRKIPTTSPFSTPSPRRTLAKRCVESSRSE